MSVNRIKIPGTDTSVKIFQKGLLVSQEALFLLDFIRQSGHSPKHQAIDLGCGSGMLSVGLAVLYPSLVVTGFEIQRELVAAANYNLEENQFQERVRIVNGDIRDKSIRPRQHTCDFVITNPPFRPQNTGLISPDRLIQSANHELSASLQDFIKIGSIPLKHKGFLAMVMIPERLSETIHYMEKYNLSPVALQWVHHNRMSPANAFLIISRKGGKGGLKVHSPLFVK